MIQAGADKEERGSLGMHYTSVPNILKVLNPLFLDDLRSHLESAEDNKAKLLNLRKRMAHIRVFDPACGSGNFLVIAYKEMRKIEAEINRRRGEEDRKSDIPINNFLRRALPRAAAGVGYRPSARQQELDHLRQRLAHRLALRLPADRNRGQPPGRRLVHCSRRSVRNRL
ncbi:hypothetical protein G6F31_018064 [Rhizopus arrhizus]|nr:hypothetical protein G6F31_018064 [Rhizopus arrhizus]